jgi:hypothetical protein
MCGDWNEELVAGDQVDCAALAAALQSLHVNTYFLQVYDVVDWSDFVAFAPYAQQAGIKLYAAFRSPSNGGAQGLPWGTDYVRWAAEIGALMGQYSCVRGMCLDDWYYDHANGFFSFDYMKQIQAAGKGGNPAFQLVVVMYHRQCSVGMMGELNCYADGVLFPFRGTPDECRSQVRFVHDCCNDNPAYSGDRLFRQTWRCNGNGGNYFITQYGEVAQTVNVTSHDSNVLRAHASDGYASVEGTFPGYLCQQIVVEGQTVWSEDMDGDEGWRDIAVDLTDLLTGRTTAQVMLRTAQVKGIWSMPDIEFYWDGVSLSGTDLRNGDFEQDAAWQPFALGDQSYCLYRYNGYENDPQDGQYAALDQTFCVTSHDSNILRGKVTDDYDTYAGTVPGRLMMEVWLHTEAGDTRVWIGDVDGLDGWRDINADVTGLLSGAVTATLSLRLVCHRYLFTQPISTWWDNITLTGTSLQNGDFEQGDAHWTYSEGGPNTQYLDGYLQRGPSFDPYMWGDYLQAGHAFHLPLYAQTWYTDGDQRMRDTMTHIHEAIQAGEAEGQLMYAINKGFLDSDECRIVRELYSQWSANRPPGAPVVQIAPQHPTTRDDLTCNITTASTDPDGDPVTYKHSWYRNDVRQPAYDDQATVPAGATANGEAWKCVVTPNDGLVDGPSGEDQVTVLDPLLEWAGSPGYGSDGVDPDVGDPNSTTFAFRVKYTDPTGNPPLLARCSVQRKGCGQGWHGCATLALTKESGDIATGAIYSASTQLPNVTLKYLFRFRASDNTLVAGDPSAWVQGPMISGVPHLCWTGDAGFEADGVNPDTGPTGTTFQFEVLYADSAGTEPTTHQLVIRRNTKPWRTVEMTPLAAGSYRFGKVYRTPLAIDQSGNYRYHFDFAHASGAALGTASGWNAGPTITGTAGVAIARVAAVPTPVGAQLTFFLSSAANVTATVLNAAGHPTRTIVADRPLDAGPQTLLWDRRADTGLPVPAGLYLIRVTARDPDGAQSSALATVSLR